MPVIIINSGEKIDLESKFIFHKSKFQKTDTFSNHSQGGEQIVSTGKKFMCFLQRLTYEMFIKTIFNFLGFTFHFTTAFCAGLATIIKVEAGNQNFGQNLIFQLKCVKQNLSTAFANIVDGG